MLGALSHADVLIWSDRGWIIIDHVAGLENAQSEAKKRIEQRRAQAMVDWPTIAPAPGGTRDATLFELGGRVAKGSAPGASEHNALGGIAGFGAPSGNTDRSKEPEKSAKPTSAAERKTRNQQQAVLDQQALRLLRSAESAVKAKQYELARTYCNQILEFALGQISSADACATRQVSRSATLLLTNQEASP